MRTVVQQRHIPKAISALTGMGRPDYVDIFTVTAEDAAAESVEEWARAVVEGAVGLAGQFVWRVLLGLDLGSRSSPDRVGGWRIAERGPDWVRLEADSWFMTPHLVFSIDGEDLSVATLIRYDRSIAPVIWGPISLSHRQALPSLLRRAVRLSRDG